MKPITPKEANLNFKNSFPEFVIQAINNCILNSSFGKESFTITQDTIIDEILRLAPEGTTTKEIFENHWLDFEDLYHGFGWKIIYDKPGWDEDYPEIFKFKAIRND
jgi:hypothetical protein